MWQSAQAFDKQVVFLGLKVAVAMALLSLGGCGMGGFNLDKAAIDRSIVTGNVSAMEEGQASDVNLQADRITIRNAASAADLEELAGQPVPWVNADTGARGLISSIAEIRDRRGELCRVFATTRENFDGVVLYKGRICMIGAGNWRIDEFEAA